MRNIFTVNKGENFHKEIKKKHEDPEEIVPEEGPGPSTKRAFSTSCYDRIGAEIETTHVGKFIVAGIQGSDLKSQSKLWTNETPISKDSIVSKEPIVGDRKIKFVASGKKASNSRKKSIFTPLKVKRGSFISCSQTHTSDYSDSQFIKTNFQKDSYGYHMAISDPAKLALVNSQSSYHIAPPKVEDEDAFPSPLCLEAPHAQYTKKSLLNLKCIHKQPIRLPMGDNTTPLKLSHTQCISLHNTTSTLPSLLSDLFRSSPIPPIPFTRPPSLHRKKSNVDVQRRSEK